MIELYKYEIYAVDNETNNIVSRAYVKDNDNSLDNAEYYFNYLITVHKNDNVTIKLLNIYDISIIKQYDSRIDMV